MKPKVLFIDDDPVMHALYKPHLERAGYEVIGLLDGLEALRVTIKEQPQVVVMDMVMPRVDGLAAILVLKAAETTKHVPILAVSGQKSYLGLQQQLQAAGVDVFLSKPFGAAKLISEIRQLERRFNNG